MKNKILPVLLALGMITTMAVSASAYDTQVTYDTTAQGQALDINGDGTTDMTLTDTVTYGIQVPASLTINGASDKAYVAGLTDTSVTLSAPTSVTLSDLKGNNLDAIVALGTDNTLKLNTSITSIGRVSADIASTWNNNAPQIGSWNGSFNYSVHVAQ